MNYFRLLQRVIFVFFVFATSVYAGQIKSLQKILVYSGGNMNSYPKLLLEITEEKVQLYTKTGECILLENNTNLLQIPAEFLSHSNTHRGSLNDSNGYIIKIIFDDNTVNVWGVYLYSYMYSKEVIEYIKKIESIIHAH